jgi:hypothetical protein
MMMLIIINHTQIIIVKCLQMRKITLGQPNTQTMIMTKTQTDQVLLVVVRVHREHSERVGKWAKK